VQAAWSRRRSLTSSSPRARGRTPSTGGFGASTRHRNSHDREHSCAQQTHNQTMVADPPGNRPATVRFPNMVASGCPRFHRGCRMVANGCRGHGKPRQPVPIGTGGRPHFPLLGCQNRGAREGKVRWGKGASSGKPDRVYFSLSAIIPSMSKMLPSRMISFMPSGPANWRHQGR
jgi:hypothetical protein